MKYEIWDLDELKYAVECIESWRMPDTKWIDRAKLAIEMAEGLNI